MGPRLTVKLDEMERRIRAKIQGRRPKTFGEARPVDWVLRRAIGARDARKARGRLLPLGMIS